ncbi:MAG TPA: ABC transporter substrate-binding protein [Burkholderiales bacterium]
MKLFPWPRYAILSGLLAALMFALSFTDAAAAAAERTKVVLAVGGKTTLYYLPLTLADRLGYFTDEGLDVEINDFPGGSKALQALIGHSADVVSGAYEHTIVMQTLAQKVEAFVLQGMNPGLELGIRKDKAAGYSWAKDLKGMKIGVSAPGSSTHMLINHLLASVGLKQDDVSIIGVGTGPSAVAAMRSGEIDAISSVEPVMTLLERSGDIKIVVETITDKGVRDVFGGSMPAATLYARVDYIEQNPKTVQALTNAIVRALLWLQKSTTEDVLNAVPPEYLLGDRALYAASFERLRPTYSKDGMIPKKGVDNSYKVLLAHNNAVRRAPVVWINQTYTNAFVEKALQKYR